MGIKEIKNCAEETLNLSGSLVQLGAGFYREVINDEINKWSNTCKIDSEKLSIIKKFIEEGIKYLDKKNIESARESFEFAESIVKTEALVKIARFKL